MKSQAFYKSLGINTDENILLKVWKQLITKKRGTANRTTNKMTTIKLNDVVTQVTDEQFAELLKAAPREVIESIYKSGLKITDRVKKFEDALAIYKPNANEQIILDYNGQDKQMISSQAHLKLSIIAKVLNEGWVPDFTNSEYKYYPWFKYSPGVGFSCDDCGTDFGFAGSFVGSRLCYKSKELAEYAAKQFEAIYNDFLN